MSSDQTSPPDSIIEGVMPSRIAQPLNLADLANVMRSAAADEQAIGVTGAGTKINQGSPPTALDVMVSTSRMDRILEHAAGDLVVTVQAGVPLAALQDHLARSRQWLALDPPESGATVGGVVAAAASGPRRLLYGTPRDVLIGVTVVLADGTVAKSGGKVVKNVAGYDLGKLFTGSFGTLGVIAECTFRLHPLPPARRVVAAEVADPAEAARSVYATGAVPTAIEWDGLRMVVLIESIESAAEIQARDIAAAINGDVGSSLPGEFGRRPYATGDIGLKVTHRLGALRDTLEVLDKRVPGARITAHVGSGVVWLAVDDFDWESLDSLRAAVGQFDGGVVVFEAPADVKRRIDVWGPARGIDVMRRIKDQFDPDHRMSPGRFVGNI
jgi:glycolate oxidase FAD binding subunit